jgi:hypothetical protein
MRKLKCKHTLTSFNVNASAVNVVFTTDGLFLTLGKMIPPLRDNLAVVAFTMACVILMMLLPAIDGNVDTGDDIVAGNVVVGNTSVKSSTTEYLIERIEKLCIFFSISSNPYQKKKINQTNKKK